MLLSVGLGVQQSGLVYASVAIGLGSATVGQREAAGMLGR